MWRRPLHDCFAALSLFLGCLGGCAPSTLSHPAILGASASAGFGCEINAPPDNRAVLVDMESVYQALVPGWHSDPVFLADAGFYTRARPTAVEQMDAALAQNPSIIIGADYLFWAVYAYRDTAMSDDAVERDRLDSLEQSLAQLDRFKGPVIVGDIPDMRAAVGTMLSARMVPPAEQLATFNRRINEWASRRPADAPAVVLPFAALARDIQAGGQVPTSFESIPADSLIQKDRLHPTPTGLVVILREGLNALAQRHLIATTDFRTHLSDAVSRLPGEALAVDNRREPGLWSLLALKGKLNDFGDAVEKKDCATAGTLFDQIMAKVSRLKKSPADMADLYVSFTLFGYGTACKDSGDTVRRWRDRLAPAIERPLPDPWPLTLWQEFNSTLGEQRLTIDRMLRLKRTSPTHIKDYSDTFGSAARSARYSDPASYLELIPSWQAQLKSEARTAKGIADYWNRQAKLPNWPELAQKNYDNALRWQLDDGGRQKITARRAEYDDPKTYIVSSRAGTLDDIVCLERALTVTGRHDDAAQVKAALDEIAGPDETAPARERVEKAAAEAAAQKSIKPS